MGDNADRYTAKVVQGSDITDFLQHAKQQLKNTSSAANKIARPLIAGANDTFFLGKVGQQSVSVPIAQIATPAPRPEPAPLDFSPGPMLTPTPQTSDLPAVNLTLDTAFKSNIIPAAPTPSPELPEVEETVTLPSGEKFSPTVNYISTEVPEENIPQFTPDVFNDAVTVFPEDPEPPTVINVMTCHFGTDWVNWEPETLRQELDSRGLIANVTADTPKHRILFDTIFAAQLLYSHSGFMDFWRMYEKLCKAFNGNPVIMQEVQTTTPPEMVYFRKLINILRPDLKEEDFGDEVLKYQAACCFNVGFYVAPKLIGTCQKHLDNLLAGKETDEFKNSLWAAEDKLYNMDVDAFNKALDDMSFDESQGSIQIAKHFAAVRYVREKVERIKSQLKLGN